MLTEFTPSSQIVPSGLDATRWDQLQPLYQELARRDLSSVAGLERLILDRIDVDAIAAEAASVLYINMTCRTDDAAANRAYLDHVEHVQPRLKEVGFELDRRIAQSAYAAELDDERYAVYLRNLCNNVQLYRPENVPLETELNRLYQEYAQVCGAMSVHFRGSERTIAQMALFQEETDRSTREEAWRAVAERRYREHEHLARIFDEMLALRRRITANAGF